MATQLNGLRPDEIRETTSFHWVNIGQSAERKEIDTG
jgi:hypothetical protein